MTIFIIPKEHEAQTLDTVTSLPVEVLRHTADYVLTEHDICEAFNVTNGHENAPQELVEYYGEVVDCITCGDYFIIHQEV